jgi:aryl-alcohol dehydrogenase-like predicted oxidoreductase
MGQWQEIARENSLCGVAIGQPSYNMFDRYIEEETIGFCERNGIGLAVYSPLAQGLLAGKYEKGSKPPPGSRAANKEAQGCVTIWDYLRDNLLMAVEQLKGIAHESGMTLSQMALAWVLRQPAVSSVIIGASEPSQIKENCLASEIFLSDEILERIERIIGVHRRAVKHNIV